MSQITISPLKPTKISASKLKTFDSCSWLYYHNYFLRVPQSEHEALPKGTLTHLICELLFNPRHRHYINKVEETQFVFSIKPFYLLARKHLTKANLFNDEVLNEINDWVFVALNNDFLCKGSTYSCGEFEFSIPHDNLAVNGFIDKLAVYKNKVVIYDYKTNKKKFTGEDKEANKQALIYLWIARHLFPGKKKYILRFLFLRFPNDPIQEHDYDATEIEGFKYYVSEIGKQMAAFKETDKTSNLAADHKSKSWLCKAGKTWECPYLRPFDYYAQIDNKTKEVFKTAFAKENLLEKEGYTIEKRHYEGCIKYKRDLRWYNNDKDDSDFID